MKNTTINTETMFKEFQNLNKPLAPGCLLPAISIEPRFYDDLGIDNKSTNYEFLRRLCWKGIQEKGIDKLENAKDYYARVKRELETFEELGFVSYILLNWEVHNFCIEKGIPKGYGRGSCGGSLILYLTKVTDVDPIKYNLFFERFVSKSRAKKIIDDDGTVYLDGSLLADVDSDISYDRRQEVIKFIEEKHAGRTAKILTLGTLSSKLVLRECGKIVDGLNEEDVGIISNNVPKAFNIPLDLKDALKESEKLKELSLKYPKTFKVAKKLEGLIKNTGVHASGIAISSDDIQSLMPIQMTKDGELVTGFEMNDVASLAVKFDILGLKTLTVVDDCCKQLGMTMKDFNPDDEKSYWPFQNLIAPQGLFQIETDATYKICQNVKPRSLVQLAAVNALSRPGASAYANQYAKFVQTGEAQSLHPFLDDVFKDTGSLCVDEDTEIFSATTNSLKKIKDIQSGEIISSINEDSFEYELDTVKRCIFTGEKEVIEVNLRDGSFIIATPEHKFLSESGWISLEGAIKNNTAIAINQTLKRVCQKRGFDRNKLLVLAYLIADGYVGNQSVADFVSIDNEMIVAYYEALKSFENLSFSKRMQIRNVTRISVKQENWKFHEPNSLVKWLRELGLKEPFSKKIKGGKTSENKFIPSFVFSLPEDDIGFFLASLFDCDGADGRTTIYYKTISKDLAYGIGTLLKLLGLRHSIYKSKYSCSRGDRTAYQISVFNKEEIFDKIVKHSIRLKRKFIKNNIKSMSYEYDRSALIDEVDKVYGKNWIGRKQFYLDLGKRDKNILMRRNQNKRLNWQAAQLVASKTKLPVFKKNTKLLFSKIVSSRPIGVRRVYDIEMSKNHNFIANGVICHNCIFQEQVLKALNKVGFDLETCEGIRKIIGKKLVDKMPEWEQKLKDKVKENNIDSKVAEVLWRVMSDSANYQFAAVHSISYSLLSYATMYLKFNHPQEFFLSLLKIAKFEQDTFAEISKVTQELPLFGMKLLPPDLSKSKEEFSIEGKDLRFGLNSIKGISEKSIQNLLDFRGHEFQNKYQVFQSAKDCGLNIGILCTLIQAGCLDSFGENRCKMVLEAQMFSKLTEKEKLAVLELGEHHKYDIFAALKDGAEGKILNAKNKSAFTEKRIQKLREEHSKYRQIFDQNIKHQKFCNWYFEREMLGYSYSYTLRDVFEEPKHTFTPVLEFNSLDDNEMVRIVGVVTEVKKTTSKKGNKYMMLSISDESGKLSGMFGDNAKDNKWSRHLEDKLPVPEEDSVVTVVGKKFGDLLMVDKFSIVDEKIYTKLSQVR